MRRMLPVAVALAAVSASFVPAHAEDSKGLKGEVYPSFKIELTLNGKAVKTLKAGTRTIKIEDKSRIHDFHLVGPGVNLTTSVAFVGEREWTVRLRPGSYRYFCDPHAAAMRGTFRVTA